MHENIIRAHEGKNEDKKYVHNLHHRNVSHIIIVTEISRMVGKHRLIN